MRGVFSIFQLINRKRKNNQPGKFQQVNGKKMHYLYMGEGEPTIIMDSALGGTCLDWSWIQQELAKEAKVFSYDRAGYGWSDSSDSPRTSETMVEELRELLYKANIHPPYILVGHSFGAINMRLFQHKYPNEVLGLVLVDPTPEEIHTLPLEYRKKLENEKKMIQLATLLAPTGLLKLLKMPVGNFHLPENKINIAKEIGYKTSAYKTASQELSSINESVAYLSETRKEVISVPLYVMTRATFAKGSLSDKTIESVQETWSNAHAKIANQSTRGKQIIVKDSGHFIHCEKPKLVKEVILELIEETKGVSKEVNHV